MTIELHFTKTNGPADEAIESLIELAGGIEQKELVRQMILAALKAGQEQNGRGDLKLMNSTLKEMRFTGKIFGPYCDRRKVTLFGSARTSPDEPIYRLAQEVGKELAAVDYMVITGAGGGIMQAVNEGAGPEHSFGVNISLPFEQKANAVLEGNPRLITYKYFFNRKVAFLKEADAVVLFPGGFGTLDEAMETLTLLQTGKRYPIPLILADEPGGSYWRGVLDFFHQHLLSRGYVSDSDFTFFEQADSAKEVVRRIERFYHRFHSMRYVGEKLVLRLTEPLEAERLEQLREEFSDMLTPNGAIINSAALPEEQDQPELAQLPRLVVDFDQQEFGPLHRFIHELND